MAAEGAKPREAVEGATIAATLGGATRRLAAAGVEAPMREARLLLAYALGIDADALRRRAPDAPADAPGFAALLARRAEEREPLAYLLGSRGFWTLELACSPATLIPRPDTETLIEAALRLRPRRPAVRRILDLGTGTGAILLAALAEYPEAVGLGTDVVPAAAALARRNAAAAGLGGRASFVVARWAAGLAGSFDLVFSNPPYVRTEEIATLMPEVSRHEPRSALDGGADGLDAYRAILPALRAGGLLAPGGLAVLEVGAGQAADVAAIGESGGLVAAGTEADLEGVARAVMFTGAAGPGAA